MQGKPTLNDTLELMRDLRERCDWDRAQTHQSLRPYLIEETHELDDAIRGGDTTQMRDELGDVLLQVLFHSVIAEEAGEFDAGDVAAALIEKMRRRHPHLYGGGEREPWEKLKSKSRRSIAEGLPPGLPALHRAHRLQERVAAVGFDWDDTEGPADKIREELDEVRAVLARRGSSTREAPEAPPVYDDAHRELEAELGDLLFACVNLCRRAGVHASVALDKANDKFVRRFEALERLAAARGLVLGEAGLDDLDRLWDEVKSEER
jgi:nucleoside triphosphate diphosphatase